MGFTLHPQLAADTLFIRDLELCRLVLMNDMRFPWLILVPRAENAVEIFDLSEAQQRVLWQEASNVARQLKAITNADKMNIATLGNQVPQLHIHLIARHKTDAAWPNPVWGCVSPPRSAYTDEHAKELITHL